MAYTKTTWVDRLVERPNTFDVQENPDGSITLIPKPGVVTEAGTPVNAGNLNNIEDGIITLEQALATHQAESSSKHIAESGSNANGNYIKFDDGTMLCWARVTHNYNLDTAQTYPMPMPFSASSIPFGSHSVGNAGSPAECMCNLGTVANAGYTSWTVRTIENNADRQNILNLFAVGRWK